MNNIKALAECCAKFKRPDILQNMLGRAKSEEDKQIIKAAVSKF